MKTPNSDHPIRNTLTHLALGAVAVFFTSSIAHAQEKTINVDFNGNSATYSGTAAAPDTGTVWNGLRASASNALLVDSANNLSGVRLTVGGGVGDFNSGAVNALLVDFLFNANSTTTTSLTGLTPGSAFSLYLYGAGDQLNQSTTFTLDAANGGASASTTGSDRLAFVTPDNYVVLTGTADGSGNISLSWTKSSTSPTFGVFNGLQLVGTPLLDSTPPTVLSIVNDSAAGQIAPIQLVTYTVTFSEEMLSSTVDVSDFANALPPSITIQSVTATANPAIYEVKVVGPATAAEQLQLQINAGAVLTDLLSNPLNTTSAILDDETLTVVSTTPTTTTVVSSGTPSTYGDSVTFTATVDTDPPGDPIPSGGTVQFFNGLNALGTAPVTAGVATLTTSAVGAGNNSIDATYSGFQTYDPSSSAPISQVVDPAVLTVKAQYALRLVDTANPDPLPFAITGFKNGETLGTSGVTGTPTLSTTAVLASPIGNYPITCAIGTLAAPNYSFGSFVDAILTISASIKAVNVDFQGPTSTTYVGVGVAPDMGTTWNPVSVGATGQALLNSVGGASGITLTLVGADGHWGVAGAADDVTRDYFFGWTGGVNTATVNLSGLTPDKAFALHLYAKGDGANQNPLITLAAGNGGASGTTSATGGPFSLAANHTLLTGITDGSGNVSFTFSHIPGNADFWAANGFQLLVDGGAPGNTFTTWASANGATGQTPQQDHDFDGVSNGIEYFMGETGSTFTANPSLNVANEISWPASAAYAGTYEVQTSPDLATWTNVDPRPMPVAGFLNYTLPTGAPGGKSFVRLLVTPTP